ncbi:MAG: type II CAAX endopeptidase family protein [Kiritimatiellia bacterium]|jgi:hypothetical protein|nr:type II CAAX endopeptidase family protein [Kiritimatiellia bacterium]MDP6848401.1 type II CAAX endopeptidase family protein [Kiritimatiellia bacterium]
MNIFTEPHGAANIEGNPLAALAGFLLLGVVLAGTASGFSAGIRLWRDRAKWRGRVRAICRRPWHLNDSVLLCCVLLLCYSFLLICAHLGIISAWSVPGETSVVSLVLQTALMPLCGLFAVVFLSRSKGISGRRAFGFGIRSRPASLKLAVQAYLAAIPLVIAAGVVYLTLLTLVGFPLSPQPVVGLLVDEQVPTWVLVYLAGMAVFVAPVFEEILFRGIALPLLLRRFHPAVAICLISAVFSAIHFHAPSFAALFTIAAAFSIAYIWTGSLAVPILMHAIFNAANIGLLILFKESVLTR